MAGILPDLTIENLQDKNIHIIGASGAEGSAILLFLWSKGCKKLTAHDFVPKEEFDKSFRLFHLSVPTKQRFEILQQVKNLPIQFHYQDTYLETIEDADLIFASQGWIKHQANYPRLASAKDAGIPFATMTQLYFTYSKAPIIAVTGSNGKSTTTALMYEILKSAGRNVYMAGNARESIQILDVIDSLTSDDVLVLETSDRQLIADIPKGPHIAVLTNLTPNHLDDHGSFENYRAVKQRLFNKQSKQDFAVINEDVEDAHFFVECTKANVLFYSEKQCKADGLYLDKQLLIKNEDLHIPGQHNKLNMLAAATACQAIGLSVEVIREGIKTFKGLPHRTALVSEKNGVAVYDDIQSTTPESTVVALNSFEKNCILIAGGDDKGMQYKNLVNKIVEKVKKLILLPGTGTEIIKQLLAKQTYAFQECNSFPQALSVALKDAKVSDILLVSPGCAHFQSNFLEGKSVKRWVEKY